MTSKASSAKNHAMRYLYFWTLKKNAVIIGIASLLTLIFRPGLLMAEYLQAGTLEGMDAHQAYHDFYTAISRGYSYTALIIIALILLLFSMNFRYLHSKSVSDLFHSLPITRARLLLTRFAATLTGVMIPILLSGVAEALFAAFAKTNGEIKLAGSLYSTAIMLVVSFAASAMMVLFCVTAGGTFDLITSLLVVNVGWVAAVLIAQYIRSRFLFGYTGNLDEFHNFLPFVRLAMLPTAQSWTYLPGTFSDSAVIQFAYWLIFGAVFLAVALILAKRRKNEAAGRPYAYTFMRYATMAVASMLTGYFFGFVFGRNNLNEPAFYIFFAIGAVLGAIIYGAIATRGFIKFYKLFATAAVCCVLFCGIIGAAKYDLFGYSTRVPSADEVERVHVNLHQTDLDISIGSLTTFSSPEAIESILAMHETAIDQREDYQMGSALPAGHLTLEYELSFGRKLTRNYDFGTPNVTALKALITTEEYIEDNDPFLQYEDQHGEEGFDFSWVNVEEYDEDFVTNANKIYRLIDCGQDYLDAHKMDLAERTAGTVSTRIMYVIKLHDGENGMNDIPKVTLEVYESDTHMLELLKKQQVIYYAGDGMWFFRYHSGEHVITHQMPPEPEPPDPTLAYTPTDGVDSLLDFEAQGGSISDYTHVQFDVVDRDLKATAPNPSIRSSKHRFGERIAEAYKKDLAALGDDYKGQAVLYSVRFMKGGGRNAEAAPITLYITEECSNTIRLLGETGILNATLGINYYEDHPIGD